MDSRPARRTENRTLLEVAITLVSLDMVTYEVTTTRDVSLHGASVLTKQQWTTNQRIDVRSLQGSFNGFARVVHCQQRGGPAFVMGLEFFFTDGNWRRGLYFGRSSAGLRFLKISLDINSSRGILALVERCVPVSTGTFCFLGLFSPPP